MLAEVAGGYRFQSHPDLAPVRRAFRPRGVVARLSAAALETLAIVAYKQPVSRAQIAAIRGVNADGVRAHRSSSGATSPRSAATPDRARPSSTAPPSPSWSVWALTALSTSCPPGGGPRCPDPRRLERARGAAAPAGADAPSGDGLTRRTPTTRPSGERLQKVLARVGLGSRRACEELIAEGRVTVNGEAACSAGGSTRPGPGRASTGCPLAGRPRARPLPAQQAGRGGHHGRRTPRAARRWSTWCPPSPGSSRSGRLDADTEGLLLLTNDGELAHRLTHPCFGVEKEYLAEVDGQPVGRRAPAAARGGGARRRHDRAGQVAWWPGRAAHRHPRRSQPAGPPHVRGRRAIRCAGWCAPGSAR